MIPRRGFNPCRPGAGIINKVMSKATSFFLDMLRMTAAFVVFVNHCARFWRPDLYPFTLKPAHGAVIVFFVLSGYVVTFSTLSKARDLKTYTVCRLARLYSVVCPALLLTLLLQIIGTSLGPHFYAQLGRGFDAARYFLALGFLQNVWRMSASPPSNGPLWSLSYEFWFYVLFGVAVFTRSVRRMVVLFALIALLVGPNILLLLPCWLLGVLLYLVRGKCRLSAPVATCGFLVSFCAMILIMAFFRFLPESGGGLWQKPLLFSGAFISDWTTGLSVFSSIFFFDRAFESLLITPALKSAVRFGSDHTFSLYLYHHPMIVFLTAIGFVRVNSPVWIMAFSAAGILFLTFLLSSVTEARRAAWRKLFSLCWDSCRFGRIGCFSLACFSNPNRPGG